MDSKKIVLKNRFPSYFYPNSEFKSVIEQTISCGDTCEIYFDSKKKLFMFYGRMCSFAKASASTILEIVNLHKEDSNYKLIEYTNMIFNKIKNYKTTKSKCVDFEQFDFFFPLRDMKRIDCILLPILCCIKLLNG